MKGSVRKLFLSALIAVLAFSCKKPKTFPAIPSIEFRSLTSLKKVSGKDSLTVITVSFTDGDGDIGYRSAGNGNLFDDPNSVYYNNFIVALYNLRNGVWVKDTIHDRSPFPGFSGRLPYLTPTTENKALQGEISMNQDLMPGVISDTIRFEVFIYDRALHKSNIITTSEIVISTL